MLKETKASGGGLSNTKRSKLVISPSPEGFQTCHCQSRCSKDQDSPPGVPYIVFEKIQKGSKLQFLDNRIPNTVHLECTNAYACYIYIGIKLNMRGGKRSQLKIPISVAIKHC